MIGGAGAASTAAAVSPLITAAAVSGRAAARPGAGEVAATVARIATVGRIAVEVAPINLAATVTIPLRCVKQAEHKGKWTTRCAVAPVAGAAIRLAAVTTVVGPADHARAKGATIRPSAQTTAGGGRQKAAKKPEKYKSSKHFGSPDLQVCRDARATCRLDAQQTISAGESEKSSKSADP